MRRYVTKMLGCDPRSPEDMLFREMLCRTVFKPITDEELRIGMMMKEPECRGFAGCVEYDLNKDE